MSDELNIDALLANVDLATVETSFPILKGGVVQFQITEITNTPAESSDKKPYVAIKYTLAQSWTTQPIDGAPAKDVAPGFPITERIYIFNWTDPKDGTVKNFGLTRLAMLREAVLGKATAGTRFNSAELLGQSVMLKLKFDPAPKNAKTGETYGPQTSVDGYVRKKSS